MIKKIKLWLKEQKARRKDIAILIRKERAGERQLADEFYQEEMAKQRNRHLDNINEIKKGHKDDLKNQENELARLFTSELKRKDEIIEKKNKELKKADKAWDFIKMLGKRYHEIAKDANILMEIMENARAADFARVKNLSYRLEALNEYINKKTPKMEQLLSISDRKEEERQNIKELLR